MFVIYMTLVLLLNQYAQAISVNPALCPTNKIAPHRRIANWGRARPRTVGYFADLFNHNDGPNDVQDGPQFDASLQEQPQDDPDDCDIEDYDENDLSSVTYQSQRGRDEKHKFFFSSIFGNNNSRPPHRPMRPPNHQPNRPPTTGYPPNRPQGPNHPTTNTPQSPNNPPNRPQSPNFPPNRPQTPNYPPNRPQPPSYPPVRPPSPSYPPVRPPYWSGGHFGGNHYRPPYDQYPSDNIKPVHEYSQDTAVTHRPVVVGGAVSHVISAAPTRPPRGGLGGPSPVPLRFPVRTVQPDLPTTRRPRRLNSDSVVGSFIDLLFK